MRRSCCYRARRGANHEPFRGAHNAPPGATSARNAQGIVLFPSEGLRLELFIREVALGSSQTGLADLTVQGEVVEWFQVFIRDQHLTRLPLFGNRAFGEILRFARHLGDSNVCACRAEDQRCWQTNLTREFPDDLCGGRNQAFLFFELRYNGFHLGIPQLLAFGSLGEFLSCSCQVLRKLRPVQPVGAPSLEDGHTQNQ